MPHSKLSRWSLTLQSYAYTIKHRPGKSHGNVDALSRMPESTSDREPPREELPALICAIDTPGLQLERIKELQHQDPALTDLINYFEQGDIPEGSISARRIMATVEDYLFEEGVLYHLDRGRARSRTNVSKQLVRPRSLKDEVMLSLQGK